MLSHSEAPSAFGSEAAASLLITTTCACSCLIRLTGTVAFTADPNTLTVNHMLRTSLLHAVTIALCIGC